VNNRPTVALTMPVNQTDEQLGDHVKAHLPALASCYAGLVAYCSRATHPAILELLRQHGVSVHVAEEEEPAGIHRIGDVRRETIRAGLLAGTSHLQMCDFDRAIHWVANYPGELREVIADIPNYDLLVLGRTERAWATHPPYQTETEPLFNRIFALVTGLRWDVGAGSRGFSRRAAGTLLEVSREQTVGIDAELPLLLLQRDGFRVGHRLCEGLEFETADRFRAEIESAGSYEAWVAQMSADPERWVLRMKLAQMIAEAIIRYGSEFQHGASNDE
jgi:hypothetical protein